MKVGDIIINPYVQKTNPLYKSMVIYIGTKYTKTLRYDGKTSEYYTRDIREWKVLCNIDLREMIWNATEEVR